MNTKGITMHDAIKNHANYSDDDYNYLNAKGYSDTEILAFWDRDAARGQGPCHHTNVPRNKAKTTMNLMLRAFQSADCHVLDDGEHRNHYEARLKMQGIDDVDDLVHDFIELMKTIN